MSCIYRVLKVQYCTLSVYMCRFCASFLSVCLYAYTTWFVLSFGRFSRVSFVRRCREWGVSPGFLMSMLRSAVSSLFVFVRYCILQYDTLTEKKHKKLNTYHSHNPCFSMATENYIFSIFWTICFHVFCEKCNLIEGKLKVFYNRQIKCSRQKTMIRE